jgi:hypothetical protein
MLGGRDVEDEAIRIAVFTLGVRALADVDLSVVDASRCLNPLRALLEIIDQKAEVVETFSALRVGVVSSYHGETDNAVRKHDRTIELAHPLQAKRSLIESGSLLDDPLTFRCDSLRHNEQHVPPERFLEELDAGPG